MIPADIGPSTVTCENVALVSLSESHEVILCCGEEGTTELLL
ncbi:hypothetical protein ACP4OV_014464 [Aristida adscensionis]